ncbi:MAG: bifunctional alpha/beta hydrolase/class I SAM-dependent methyltransferase [Syntrophotaleaceae bacterium]
MEDWTTSEGTFLSWDDTSLFYRSWKPAMTSDRAVIIIHRGHEHSGRVASQVEGLGLTGFWAFSWDNRGHGQSPGERGHADSYYHLVRDLDAFVRHVSEQYGIPVENIAVVANSVGAVTASAWVHDYAPRIRALVLAAPAFRIRLYVPLAIPLLRLLLKIKGKAFVSSYVKSKMLTHDAEAAFDYDADRLITKEIAVNILLEMHDTATRIIEDAAAITTPTLVLSAGSDWVVKNAAQRQFYRRLGSTKKRMEAYPGFFHALLNEKERQRPLTHAREFILEAFDREIDRSALLEADRGGPTRTEYDLLRQSTTWPSALFYAIQKLGMQTIGRMSDGIRLGWRTGFDSGQSLDYVYENRPRGLGFPGKFLDRNYLNAIGWKGIRHRRENLEKLLTETIERISASGEPVSLLDVATGCGRYVLNVLKVNGHREISALLRDFTPANLDQGRALAAEMGLENVRFEQGDAFDPDSIRAVGPRPNLAIVSGLYELFPDNGMVCASLKGIADVMEPGGYLLYTGQPWHPQVDMIARVLSNRDGDPWIMRRRSQAEMDELVRAVGFEKIAMEVDQWGIFTVSVARRAAN